MFENGDSLIVPVKDLADFCNFVILKVNRRLLFVSGEHRQFRIKRTCRFYDMLEAQWLSEAEIENAGLSFYPVLPHFDFIALSPQPIHVSTSFNNQSLGFYLDQSYKSSPSGSHELLRIAADPLITAYLADTVFPSAIRDSEGHVRWRCWHSGERLVNGCRLCDLRIPDDEIIQIILVDDETCRTVSDKQQFEFVSLKWLRNLSSDFQEAWRTEFRGDRLLQGWRTRLQSAYRRAVRDF